jgi:hypothetical protein
LGGAIDTFETKKNFEKTTDPIVPNRKEFPVRENKGGNDGIDDSE